MLNIDSVKKDVAWDPNSGVRFLITGMVCLEQCSHSDSEVVAPGRSPDVFTRVTGIECSFPRAFPGSHAFNYNPAVVKRTLTRTRCITEVLNPPLTVFVGHRYWQNGRPGMNVFQRPRYHIKFIPSDMKLNDAIVF